MTLGSDGINHRRTINFVGIWSASTGPDSVCSSFQSSHCTHCKQQVAFNSHPNTSIDRGCLKTHSDIQQLSSNADDKKKAIERGMMP